MASVIEYRVMLNRPGPGWYWEVIHKHEILARGLADSPSEADAVIKESIGAFPRVILAEVSLRECSGRKSDKS